MNNYLGEPLMEWHEMGNWFPGEKLHLKDWMAEKLRLLRKTHIVDETLLEQAGLDGCRLLVRCHRKENSHARSTQTV